MNDKDTDTQFIVDILTDKEKWDAAVLIQLLKGILIAIIFTVLTCLLFNGLWFWVTIGIILVFVLPIRNILKLRELKKDYDEFSNLFHGLPDQAKIKLYKTVLQSDSSTTKSKIKVHLLTKEASKTIMQTLVSDGILRNDDVAFYEAGQSREIMKLLRKHLEKRICHFDCECIENDDDYKYIMEDILSITQDKLFVQNINSKFDHELETCKISFKFNDKKITWDFQQLNDWISDDFLKYLSEFISENTDCEFLMFPADDQCAEIIFIPKPSARLLVKYGILLKLY